MGVALPGIAATQHPEAMVGARRFPEHAQITNDYDWTLWGVPPLRVEAGIGHVLPLGSLDLKLSGCPQSSASLPFTSDPRTSAPRPHPIFARNTGI
ncbi:MAG TPA: hypothetical protein VF104_06540 [Burkholderiales bacterium]